MLISALVVTVNAHAEPAADRPAFQNLRFEEDWSNFDREAIAKKDFFDPIKNVEIGEKVHLSVGGELRVRGEFWENFGFVETNDEFFVQFRTFLHTDWRFGEHARLFVQGKFATSSDRDLPGGRRPALDMDEGDLWNAFFELKFKPGKQTYLARVGRQELQYGAQRLISPLDWSNNRRIFEGALFRTKNDERQWQLDAFWTRPVVIDPYDFNEAAPGRDFAGAYFTKKGLGPLGLDAYLLYSEKINVDDDRFTWGSRLFGSFQNGLAFDAEGGYQHGHADSLDVSAWMLAAEATYTFAEPRFKPWVALGIDFASGDGDPDDGRLETFDQLYPLGHAYLGYTDFVGRQNIIDLHATTGVKLPVKKATTLRMDVHHFWLADEEDALYNAGGGVVRPGGAGERDVGWEIDLTANVNIGPHTKFAAGYSVFLPGQFIDATGPDDTMHFVYSQLGFTF